MMERDVGHSSCTHAHMLLSVSGLATVQTSQLTGGFVLSEAVFESSAGARKSRGCALLRLINKKKQS